MASTNDNNIVELNKKKMQFAQYGRECLASMGFMPNHSVLNKRVLGGLFLSFLNVCIDIMFIVYEANTFWEYTNAIFVTLTNGVSFVLFIVFIVRIWRVFGLIDFAQTFIEDSK